MRRVTIERCCDNVLKHEPSTVQYSKVKSRLFPYRKSAWNKTQQRRLFHDFVLTIGEFQKTSLLSLSILSGFSTQC